MKRAKKAKTTVTGRPTLFGTIEGGDRIQGHLTRIGSEYFEANRAKLARLVGKEPQQVSDGNTAEWLSRGCPSEW